MKEKGINRGPPGPVEEEKERGQKEEKKKEMEGGEDIEKRGEKGDKKRNTMLLTVIAVATLLVAVVGATFAYFSLSVTGSATTTASVQTGKVGTIQITGGSKKLTLNVTAQDMAKPTNGKDIYYYAVDETHNQPQDTGGIYAKQESGAEEEAPEGTNVALGTVQLLNSAENDEYTCKYKLTITADKEEDLKKFKSGNLVLTIGGSGIVDGSANDSTPKSVIIDDFSDFTNDKVLHGQFTLNDDTQEDIVNATMYLINSNSTNQSEGESSIAGLNVSLTLKVEPEGECTIKSNQGK